MISAPAVLGGSAELRENLLHDCAVHVGEPEMPALVFEGQAGVVDAQGVQDRGVQIVDVDRILGYVIGVVIRFPDGETGFDAGSCHPNRKAARVVVAAIIVGC